MADSRHILRLIPIVVLLPYFFVSMCAWDKKDLRNVSWGMTRFQVMASEDDAPEFFDDPEIYYSPEVAGRVHHLVYGFINDKLVDAKYIITTFKGDDYLTFKKIIEKKYGKPSLAVDKGKNNYRFFWSNDSTEVTLKPGRLRECQIEYIGKKYKYLKEREDREKTDRAEKALMWAY